MTEDRIFTAAEAAELLHKSKKTIYFYIRSGQLKAIKPGGKNFLIYESDLNEFIKNGVRPGSYQETYPRPHKRTPKQ